MSTPTPAPALQVYGPPVAGVPLTDESWKRWFNDVVWPIIGKGAGTSGPQGTFPQLQVGKATFTNNNAFQELIDLNQGIYVTYSSTVENIIYGFACNVFRGAGISLTVGAQINAIVTNPGTEGVFGIACTAAVNAFTGSTPMIAFEPDIGNASSTNLSQKWCINAVFKDRGDGDAATQEGLGSNRFNYSAYAIVLTSQARSTSTEFCGWSTGLQFLDAALDEMKVTAWSNTTLYIPGDVVSRTGVNWKCVTVNINVAPTAITTQWVQYGNATDSGAGFAYAVGIDFTPMTVTSMGRMWSAIRLRNTMAIHWEETASIASYMDSATGRFVIAANWNVGLVAYFRLLQVDVSTGNLWVANGIIANGGGAAPTFGTIGGTGPAAAAQNGWYKVIDSTTSTAFYLPVWK